MKSYHPDDKSLLGNWFDPHDLKHMEAWRELNKVGEWPVWFQEMRTQANVSSHSGWNRMIMHKICDAWESHLLD